jgi:hypothetical protein
LDAVDVWLEVDFRRSSLSLVEDLRFDDDDDECLSDFFLPSSSDECLGLFSDSPLLLLLPDLADGSFDFDERSLSFDFLSSLDLLLLSSCLWLLPLLLLLLPPLLLSCFSFGIRPILLSFEEASAEDSVLSFLASGSPASSDFSLANLAFGASSDSLAI